MQVLSKKIAKTCYIKKLENYSMAKNNLSVNYCQTPWDVFWALGLERLEYRKINVKKNEKICTLRENAKTRYVKMLKPFYYN